MDTVIQKLTDYQAWKKSWRDCFSDGEFRVSLFWTMLLMGVSLGAGYFANAYATLHAGPAVPDAILSNFPALHIFFLYAYAPMIGVIVLAVVLIRFPLEIPFAVKTLSLCVLARSMAVCLTHLGIPPGIYIPEHAPAFFKRYFLGGDLFFSGHVRFPLLVALIYWNYKKFRIFFILYAIFLAFVVLGGHYHYSIDVFGAVFIVPTIYMISRKLFPIDFARFQNAL